MKFVEGEFFLFPGSKDFDVKQGSWLRRGARRPLRVGRTIDGD